MTLCISSSPFPSAPLPLHVCAIEIDTHNISISVLGNLVGHVFLVRVAAESRLSHRYLRAVRDHHGREGSNNVRAKFLAIRKRVARDFLEAYQSWHREHSRKARPSCEDEAETRHKRKYLAVQSAGWQTALWKLHLKFK